MTKWNVLCLFLDEQYFIGATMTKDSNSSLAVKQLASVNVVRQITVETFRI